MVSSEERKDLDAIWNVLDEHKKGTLSKRNLRSFFERSGRMVDDQVLDDIFDNANLNNDGRISYSEFLVVSIEIDE
jgi:Ca2+-binding EF-hand superfamily protein